MMKARYQVVDTRTNTALVEFKDAEARERWINLHCEKRRGQLQLLENSTPLERRTRHT